VDRTENIALPNRFLNVTIVDPSNNPVPDATLTISDIAGGIELFSGVFTTIFYNNEAITDASGTARLEVFPDQSLTLTVNPPSGSGFGGMVLHYLIDELNYQLVVSK